MNFKVTKGSHAYTITQGRFPGGEVLIKVIDNVAATIHTGVVKIVAKIQNSDDLFALALVKDAIINLHTERRALHAITGFHLVIPYVPYARQDRACVIGESFSLKVFGNFINSLGFDRVTVVDPHSDVTAAVINNVEVINQVYVVHMFDDLIKECTKPGCILISPDAGANKKTMKQAQYFDHVRFLRADKLRDLATGNIIETVVYADDLTGLNVFIFDDICDGGRTFVELAAALKKKNAATVNLFVTHGIFSKGYDALLKNGIDKIYTTNTFQENNSVDGVTVINLDHIY